MSKAKESRLRPREVTPEEAAPFAYFFNDAIEEGSKQMFVRYFNVHSGECECEYCRHPKGQVFILSDARTGRILAVQIDPTVDEAFARLQRYRVNPTTKVAARISRA